MLVQAFRFLVILAVFVAGPVCAQEATPVPVDEELIVIADVVPAAQPDKPTAPSASSTQVLQELAIRLEEENARVET